MYPRLVALRKATRAFVSRTGLACSLT